MLRHRAGPIVAVIDPDHAGQPLEQITGIARDVPVVADVATAAPTGGGAWWAWLLREGGCLILSATTLWRRCVQAFTSPADSIPAWLVIPNWRKHAVDRWIWDLRQEPEGLIVGQGTGRSPVLSATSWPSAPI